MNKVVRDRIKRQGFRTCYLLSRPVMSFLLFILASHLAPAADAAAKNKTNAAHGIDASCGHAAASAGKIAELPGGTKTQFSAAELTNLLTNGNTGITASNLSVLGTGPGVTVLAEKDPGASDRELKIEAMFIARALTQSAQVATVKVVFSQPGKEGRFVTVSRQEVLDYGAGRMSAERLLSTLTLQDVSPPKAPNVEPGEQFERRLLVWERIEKLRKQGTGVVPFQKIFANVEAMVKSGKTDEIGQQLSYLEGKLADQEELCKQAKSAQRGIGVSSVKQVQSQPTAINFGSSPFSLGAGFPLQMLLQPPDPNRMEQSFKQESEQMIRQVSNTDPAAGQRLRTLKRQIESDLSTGHKPHAWALMEQFQIAAQAASGGNPFGVSGGMVRSTSGPQTRTGSGQGPPGGNGPPD
jgi:hypothetical protein